MHSTYLHQIFILPLKERLLPVPELSELSVLSLGRSCRASQVVSILRSRLVAPGRWPSCRWPCPSLPRLSRLLLFVLGLPFDSLLVKTLVTSDVLLFLLTFGDNLDTLGADARLEFGTFIIDFFTASKMFLRLFHCLLIVGILATFGDRSRWLLSFLQYLLAVRIGLRDKVALLLHLSLDLPLFQFNILLLSLQMLRHSLFPRLEPPAHLF